MPPCRGRILCNTWLLFASYQNFWLRVWPPIKDANNVFLLKFIAVKELTNGIQKAIVPRLIIKDIQLKLQKQKYNLTLCAITFLTLVNEKDVTSNNHLHFTCVTTKTLTLSTGHNECRSRKTKVSPPPSKRDRDQVVNASPLEENLEKGETTLLLSPSSFGNSF